MRIQIGYKLRATTLIPHSEEEDLWLVTFTPVYKPGVWHPTLTGVTSRSR